MWSFGTSEAQSGLSGPTRDLRTPGQAAHHAAQVTQHFPGGALPTVQGWGTGNGEGGALFILNQQKTKQATKKQNEAKHREFRLTAEGQAAGGTYYGNRYSLAHPPPACHAATGREKHR